MVNNSLLSALQSPHVYVYANVYVHVRVRIEDWLYLKRRFGPIIGPDEFKTIEILGTPVVHDNSVPHGKWKLVRNDTFETMAEGDVYE